MTDDPSVRQQWACLTANLAKLVDAHHDGRHDEADQAAAGAARFPDDLARGVGGHTSKPKSIMTRRQ